MEFEIVESVAHRFIENLPDPIKQTLEAVEILVLETPQEASAQLFDEMMGDGEPEPGEKPPTPAEIALMKEQSDLPPDCKGAFIGEPLEKDEDSNEDPGEQEAYDPEGWIVLCASNIQSADEVVLVLCHEIGHALGLDEDGVKELGLAVAKGAAESKTQNDGSSSSNAPPLS